MRILLTFLSFLTLIQSAVAQKREEYFDHQFKPSGDFGRYYFVETEKKDAVWERKAWYLSQRTIAMQGSYLDDSCKVPHGVFTWYHPNGYPKLTGRCINGKREGAWLGYDEKGVLNDSSNYKNDRRFGVSYRYHDNGFASDSLYFDGQGNGVQVSWNREGVPTAAGFWTQDTLRRGRWKYFHDNGKEMAWEDYKDGKLVNCACFDSTGVALDTALCREQEPKIDLQAWRRFLERGLQPLVEQKAREGISGTFTVMVRFLVNKDGTLSDIKALTNYGYGIEEGVIRMMRSAPKWKPGRMHGRIVRSYHSQPITFVISN